MSAEAAGCNWSAARTSTFAIWRWLGEDLSAAGYPPEAIGPAVVLAPRGDACACRASTCQWLSNESRDQEPCECGGGEGLSLGRDGREGHLGGFADRGPARAGVEGGGEGPGLHRDVE